MWFIKYLHRHFHGFLRARHVVGRYSQRWHVNEATCSKSHDRPRDLINWSWFSPSLNYKKYYAEACLLQSKSFSVFFCFVVVTWCVEGGIYRGRSICSRYWRKIQHVSVWSSHSWTFLNISMDRLWSTWMLGLGTTCVCLTESMNIDLCLLLTKYDLLFFLLLKLQDKY